jgi:hypothetical protein
MPESLSQGLHSSQSHPDSPDLDTTLGTRESSPLNQDKYHSYTANTLSVVKHLNDQLIGYFEYSSLIYGQDSFVECCVVHFYRIGQEWTFKTSQMNRNQSPVFMSFLSETTQLLIDHDFLDLQHCQSSLSEFESIKVRIPTNFENFSFSLLEVSPQNELRPIQLFTSRLKTSTKRIFKRLATLPDLAC